MLMMAANPQLPEQMRLIPSCAEHFDSRYGAQVLNGVGGILDGVELLFGSSDRRAALRCRKTH
jgi:hypothetical protein